MQTVSKSAFKRVRKALSLPVCRKPLDAYALPGGYPLFYLTSDGACLCPTCANAHIEDIDAAQRERLNDGWRVVAHDVNWEDNDNAN